MTYVVLGSYTKKKQCLFEVRKLIKQASTNESGNWLSFFYMHAMAFYIKFCIRKWQSHNLKQSLLVVEHIPLVSR